MRVLVTGGAGFIGSNIVAALVARGDQPVVVDTFESPDQWRNLAKLDGVEVGDDVDGVDGVVHMAAISSPAATDTRAILDANLHLSQHYWELAQWEGVPFVYASSAGVYGNAPDHRPLTPYGWSKLLFDQWVEREGAKGHTPPVWAGLRFTNVYGPNEYHKPDPSPVPKWYAQAVGGFGPIVYRADDCPSTRDFVYVEDVVSVVLWCLDQTRPLGIMDVGTGEGTSWDAMAAHVIAANGRGGVVSAPFPDALLPRYQWATRAELTALRAAGYTGTFRGPEEGVHEYVTRYLATGDRYR